jgi:hypothetical protein
VAFGQPGGQVIANGVTSACNANQEVNVAIGQSAAAPLGSARQHGLCNTGIALTGS